MERTAIAGRPITTYSIAARDGGGALAVGVQSHWFNVGGVVPWVEHGVGAIAVQSISDPSTGRRGLSLLRAGLSAAETLDRLLDGDPDAAYRQVAIVDARGRVATHSGELCIPEAGHVTGDGFSAQANLMERDSVWPAMARAFEAAQGDLAERVLAALDAAQAEGGDIRGRQAAALVVVSADDGAGFDLRVEDARDPLGELRRLVAMQRAYHALNHGDAMMSKGEFERALEAYERASEMLPDDATDGEAAFWAGVAYATTGRVDEAERFLARAAAVDDRWARLVPRLVRSRMLPDDDTLIVRLVRALSG
jgi:uncharacterized Ntn-hydrolase superfamily protein